MKVKHIFQKILVVLCIVSISSCDYLDIVPDNTLTVEHAFKSRYEAEGYLYGIYGFLPSFADAAANPALLGGDEVWYMERAAVNGRLWNIARGFQGTAAPLGDYWASNYDSKRYDLNGGLAIFTALRDCNIFLENVDKVIDLSEDECIRWKAEVKFLKAYFHFWLLRMYGPIPIIRENLSMDDPGLIYRAPVDEVVEYIVSLIDEAVTDLPPKIDDIMLELGRATQPIALAVKAQTLTLAASPLFNGNPDYATFVDKSGTQLFPVEYSAEKWKRAADALKEAIDAAHGTDESGSKLFDFKRETVYGSNLNEKTVMAMQVRGAVTERWNSEIIWGASNSGTGNLQRMCHPIFFVVQGTGGIHNNYAPPLHIVEQFYTKNGVPIEEDKDWVGVEIYKLRMGDEDHKLYIAQNQETMNLHFNREARFYGSITFDNGTYYGNGRITSDNNLWVTKLKEGAGSSVPERSLSTGYQCKKLLHYMTSVPDDNSNMSIYEYAFPIIRLADLYLMYAEALNEWKAAPDDEVYEYIDLVRARTGLEGVVDSWSKYAVPEAAGKPLTQDGMREIIQRERMNELAFEGIRFWDLRRWKLAKEYMNKIIWGLNTFGEGNDYYTVQKVYQLSFMDKDYLWPIRQGVIMKNNNLVQNPGW
ncbi:MAG: RagB/SusD family nutrient uptake outer membrane protein [Bacteroidales bacterium]|jgi:hypothetical protein|nr:RagB/SusD family nutrient uptake outer membrane protein [Bacteroidales bacterium]